MLFPRSRVVPVPEQICGLRAVRNIGNLGAVAGSMVGNTPAALLCSCQLKTDHHWGRQVVDDEAECS